MYDKIKGAKESKEPIKYYGELKKLQEQMPDGGFINKETYVDDAFACLSYFDTAKKEEKITSSKIRSLYSMLCDIINDEKDKEETTLDSDIIDELNLLRVRIIYDMGRDNAVKIFMEKTYLVAYLIYIEKNATQENFKLFCKYFEALVAFHRYMNPKEN